MKQLKKRLTSILLLFLLILFLPFSVFAHPGRTDSNGGHYNRETGEYHYHHGYPEHQHPNGICPYNFDDATDDDSDSGENDRSVTATPAITSSSSSSSNSQDSRGSYQAGYTAGRSDGIQEGYERGKRASETQPIYLYIALGATTIILIILIFVVRKAQKLKDENYLLNRHVSDKVLELDSQADKLEALTSAHETLKKTYNSLYNDYRTVRSNLVKTDALTVDYEVKIENLAKVK